MIRRNVTKQIKIKDRVIDNDSPIYFIADIASNHDGDLRRAKNLISLAKKCGADAAKFQHFQANKIVSDYGFKQLGQHLSHQSNWGKSVYEIYEDYSLNREWTEKLYNHCLKENIHFFSSPYDFEAVDILEPFMYAYKIGSGDITWHDILRKIAKKSKPVILATGASNLKEVIDAVDCIKEYNNQLVLMQCNTNYTAKKDNFKYISLNVLKTYKLLFPEVILGLSDHTLGHTTVIGAVTLGARVVEKHFTDNNSRKGPDHPFSMNPDSWCKMVEATHELESALGNSLKRIENNENDTVILQRRCLRSTNNIKKGHIIKREDIDILRPAPINSLKPNDLDKIIGKKVKSNMVFGQHFTWEIIEW